MEEYVSFRRLQEYHNNVKGTLSDIMGLTNQLLNDLNVEKQDKLTEEQLNNINSEHIKSIATSDTSDYDDVF